MVTNATDVWSRRQRQCMNLFRATVRSTHIRRRVAASRMCCERLAYAYRPVTPFPQQARRGRILCYHSVGTPAWGVNDVSPKKFRSHVEQALASGYRFVPAEVIALGQGGPRDLAITFDDGLSSVAIHAAPVLATYNIPWTLFVVAQWAEGQHAWGASTFLSWRDIERLVEMGVTIGSHSVSHPRFRYLSSDETAQELEDSRRIIESRIGILPATFAI